MLLEAVLGFTVLCAPPQWDRLKTETYNMECSRISVGFPAILCQLEGEKTGLLFTEQGELFVVDPDPNDRFGKFWKRKTLDGCEWEQVNPKDKTL